MLCTAFCRAFLEVNVKNLKHIGRLKTTGTRVIVVFRTVPGESDHALVVPVSALSESRHQSIMELIETPQAQQVFEFGEIMHIRYFPDGQPMLLGCQASGLLKKVATTDVIMTPNTKDEINLAELNIQIAKNKNCAVDDLCLFVSGAKKTDIKPQPASTIEEVTEIAEVTPEESQLLTDIELAKRYRSQADELYKEAAKLRMDADNLDPPKPKPKRAPSTAKQTTAKRTTRKTPTKKTSTGSKTTRSTQTKVNETAKQVETNSVENPKSQQVVLETFRQPVDTNTTEELIELKSTPTS